MPLHVVLFLILNGENAEEIMEFTNAILVGTSIETLGITLTNQVKSNCIIGFSSLQYFTDWMKYLCKNTEMIYNEVTSEWLGVGFEELVCICIKEDNDTTMASTVLCLIRKGAQRGRFKEFLDVSKATKACSAILYPTTKQVAKFLNFTQMVQTNAMLRAHVTTTTVVCSSVVTVDALHEIIDNAGMQMQ
jgi:hypothetical protein